jgi:hypothetical protein
MKAIINAKTKEIVIQEYVPQELTEEQIKKQREQQIRAELNELDQTINRATEDLYVLTNSTPYTSIAEVISRKNELRQELKEVL